MIAALTYAGIGYALWVMFLAVMALSHAWATLPPLVKALAIPAAALALVLDGQHRVARNGNLAPPGGAAQFCL